jgi:hypothetical protein
MNPGFSFHCTWKGLSSFFGSEKMDRGDCARSMQDVNDVDALRPIDDAIEIGFRT